MREMPPLEDLFQLECSAHNAERLRIFILRESYLAS